MKSSGNSAKNIKKSIKDDFQNPTENLLKLKKCDESFLNEKEKGQEEISFWSKMANMIGCGCFKISKK